MRLFVCGVRGSTPAPGPEFVRYGGNTSCVAVATDDDEEPRLVLDAGTGLQRLSRVLGGQAFRGTILLGHLHWDHTHGLPFFSAGDRPDSHVTVLVPAQESGALVLLERVMSPPHFPIGPSELRGSWEFDDLNDGSHDVEGFRVLALEIPHKGGRTFGYRITDSRGASMAYLSDHGPISLGPGPCGHGEYHAAARELVDGVDVLVHDAQYTAAEFEARRGFGHSTVDYAVGLATECHVGSLLLFHHDPPRTDDELDAVVAGFASAPVRVAAAREGAVVMVART
jgi:phosphoribosyl 1,2-cyclic phosphodiesterase